LKGGAEGAPSAEAGWQRLAAVEVPVGQIAPDPEQPRTGFSEERMQALTASVRACGVILPLLVRRHPDAEARGATPLMLIAGERRWAAARRAGLAAVPVVLREAAISLSDRLMLQVAENDDELHEALPLCDLASAVGRAFDLARCSQVQFARHHRRSPAWISIMLRLAQAEGATRDALREGLLQGLLAAQTFLRLSRAQQRSLLAEARETGVPIGWRRAEKAAARTAARRGHRQAAKERAGGGGEPAAWESGGGGGGGGSNGGKGGGGGGGSNGGKGAGGERGAGGGGEGGAGSEKEAMGSGTSPRPCGNGPESHSDFPPAASFAAHPPTPSAAPAAQLPAGAAPASCACLPGRSAEPFGAAVAAPGRTLAWAPRPKGGPAAPVAVRPLRLDGPWVTIEITVRQLEKLVTLLGHEPAGGPRELVEQLLAFL
jgi:ParB/RepB/Spo0J family partition protein